MTVWMFYLRHQGFDTTSLYAYTNNKKFAKEFEEQRSKERIVMMKRSNFTKEEWNALNNTRPGLRIVEGMLHTKGPFHTSKQEVRVLCTAREEEMAVLHADKIWEESARYLFDARALKSEYLVALERLLFMKFYCFFVIKRVQDADYFYEPYYSNFGPPENFIYEDFKENFCDYDELRIFLKMFKHTFAEDKG